jgi:hypothetical protein
MGKWLMGSLILAGGVLGVSYLQKRFDDADIRKAIHAVLLKHPEASGCRAEIVSRMRGHVRVRCGDRAWMVDIVHGQILE